MSTKVKETFDRYADAYDAKRRIFVPPYDHFYGAAIDLIPFSLADRFSLVDLGAGTGLLSAHVSSAFPNARLMLIDFSEPMLSKARARFASNPNVEYLVADYSRTPLPHGIDVYVSALSIHHLEHEQKRELFRLVADCVKSGGIFIQADLVAGETKSSDAVCRRMWERAVLEGSPDEEELEKWRQRSLEDICAPLSAQLEWLREAGFSDVDCFYKWYNFAVFAGRR